MSKLTVPQSFEGLYPLVGLFDSQLLFEHFGQYFLDLANTKPTSSVEQMVRSRILEGGYQPKNIPCHLYSPTSSSP